MTPSRTIDQDVRHDPGGSIDIDFYRARAIELRGEAMRDVRMVRATCVGLLTMLAVLAIVALANNAAD